MAKSRKHNVSSCITHNELIDIIDYDETIKTQPFILAAGVIRSQVEANDTGDTLSSGELDQIELYLAAHLYSVRDRQLSHKKTADASGTFDGKTEMYLESSLYGQTAILLDTSGFLKRRNDGKSNNKLGVITPGKDYSAANGNIHESY